MLVLLPINLGIKSLLLIDLFSCCHLIIGLASYCNLDSFHDRPLKHVHRRSGKLKKKRAEMSVSKELEGLA